MQESTAACHDEKLIFQPQDLQLFRHRLKSSSTSGHLHQRPGCAIEQPDTGIDQYAGTLIADGALKFGVRQTDFTNANVEPAGHFSLTEGRPRN